MADRRVRQRPDAPHRPLVADHRNRSVAVLGLGRFGAAVASELLRLGHDVLGVDENAAVVQAATALTTVAAQADITNADALRQLGVTDVAYAVVAVGSDLEASILATAALDELGVPEIWAKAVSRHHGRILERVGAHHVVYPEHDMGHQVAHMVGGRILDWFQLDEQFALVETTVPAALVGRTVADSGVRERHGVTIVCVKPRNGSFTYATPETVLAAGDLVVVAGETVATEAFARLR